MPLIAASRLKKKKKDTLKTEWATQAMTIDGDDNVDFSTFIS